MACNECTITNKELQEAKAKVSYLEQMLTKREHLETDTAILNKMLQAEISRLRQSSLEGSIEHK